MFRSIFIIVFVFCVFSCDNTRNKIFDLSKDELVKDIAKENIVAGAVVGPGGMRPDQFVRYLALKTKTNEQDLIDLTDHTNTTVRCYAFTGLMEMNSKAILDLVLKKVSDTGKVKTYYGCLLSTLSVCEFYVKNALEAGYINQAQKHILDSIIFSRDDFHLISSLNILETLPPTTHYYKLIKERTAEDPEYIVALAKYRNPGDKQIIFDLLKNPDRSTQYWGLRAVINYPDKSFFQPLRMIAKANYNTTAGREEKYLKALYQALVQYKSQSSKDILKETIHNANGMDSIKKIDLVYGALKKYPDSVYKNLIQYF